MRSRTDRHALERNCSCERLDEEEPTTGVEGAAKQTVALYGGEEPLDQASGRRPRTVKRVERLRGAEQGDPAPNGGRDPVQG